MKFALLSVLIATAAACSPPQATPEQASSHQTAAAIEVHGAWASVTPGGVGISAGYMTIANSTQTDDRLIGASSPRAASVDIHQMSMDDGVMRMRAAPDVTIPAGGEATLAPGGLHLMFMGVTQPFTEGESIPVQLTFANAGQIDVSLPVQRGPAAHGH